MIIIITNNYMVWKVNTKFNVTFLSEQSYVTSHFYIKVALMLHGITSKLYNKMS